MAWLDYKELIVWQKSMDLIDTVYALVKTLPREEQFVLSDQMRRACISISSNIAEGYGRNSKNELKQFLSIAKGSSFELETQLLVCARQYAYTKKQTEQALNLCNEVQKILTKLILTLDASAALNTEH